MSSHCISIHQPCLNFVFSNRCKPCYKAHSLSGDVSPKGCHSRLKETKIVGFSNRWKPCYEFHSPGFSPMDCNSRLKKTIIKGFSGRFPTTVMEPARMTILNEYGEKLVGLLHDTGSKEVIILCHGFRSSKNQTTMVNLASALEAEGISAFRFDFSGNGESEGNFDYGNYMKEVGDLHAVVKHFNAANRVVSTILGHSKGGGVVLLYASKYSDVRAVVNLSGRYRMERGVKERLGGDVMERIEKESYVDVKDKGNVLYRVTKESLMERLNTDMHEACLKIDKDCRVLTVHGSSDETIPVEDAHEIAKIIPNHKLQIIEGADHRYSKHQEDLAEVVVKFYKGLHSTR